MDHTLHHIHAKTNMCLLIRVFRILQQRNLDLPTTPSSKPIADIEASHGGEAPIAGVREVVDLAIYWENPVLSSVLCLVGGFVAVAGDYMLKGKHGVPLLSGGSLSSLLMQAGFWQVERAGSTALQFRTHGVKFARNKRQATVPFSICSS